MVDSIENDSRLLLTHSSLLSPLLSSPRHLRRLDVNMATRPVMIRLVQRMPVYSLFMFHFFKPSIEQFFELEIKKSATQLNLKVTVINPDDPMDESLSNIHSGNIHPDDVETFFNSHTLDEALSHWLDDR